MSKLLKHKFKLKDKVQHINKEDYKGTIIQLTTYNNTIQKDFMLQDIPYYEIEWLANSKIKKHSSIESEDSLKK
jgi:hypothetical protein